MSPRSPLLLSAFAALFALGCSDELPTPYAGPPSLGEPVQVVPFAEPVAGVTTQDSNNNINVTSFEGRYYMAFRTAPSHFASEKTELYVVSSEDQKEWQFEAVFALGTDIREPAFVSYRGQLILYFAVLGKDSTKYEPQGTMITRRQADGSWTTPVWWTDQPGFIPWRTKVINDVAYMTGYIGGENIYLTNGEPIQVKWLKSSDGLVWEPAVEGLGDGTVEKGGGSETDFVFLDDGGLVAVTRNEAGDETGWGSKICRASASDLGNWVCASDPRKYDSPLMFRHGPTVYLVARRNVTETGNYDLFMRDKSHKEQTETYEVTYSFNPKRCSVWRVDPDTLTVEFLVDLPSKGDTCFPTYLPAGPGEIDLYNYTNDYTGEQDYFWIQGQGLPTFIYRIRLSFPDFEP